MPLPTAVDADDRAATSRLLTVVGVGASAGGLAPTGELLQHLGSAPGLALVVIHHLDPAHESELANILRSATSMPVALAQEGVVVEANHVYVIPQNTSLSLVEGKLALAPRPKERIHYPIDRFFESLAADRSVCPVGVVLSGTGVDGSAGIRAIKGEGGVTFVQDQSAVHRGMPDSASETGCVDFVLSPDLIAAELLRIGAQAPSVPAAGDDAELARILAILRRETAIDFAGYKDTTVRRRIHRRLLVHRLSSLREYTELLVRDPVEAGIVGEEILIHVTSFFRDPDLYAALRTTVFPRIFEGRPRDTALRIWVAGCSTGEEVYSIAIALLEHMIDLNVHVPIKIFGTDVSTRAIETARTGIYPTAIESNLSEAQLTQFFTRIDGGYQIRSEVRDVCIFAKHDATIDPPFSAVDFISCRNLMIYLGPRLQDRLLPIFHYALKEPGFLVLGTSETTRSFPGFVLVDARCKIYARSSAAPRVLLDFADLRAPQPPHEGTPSPSKVAGPIDVHREADRLVLAEFAPPGVVVTNDLAIVQFRGKTGPYLEPMPGVASFDLLRMVRDDLRVPLRRMIDEARNNGRAVRIVESFSNGGAAKRSVEIEVIPFAVATTVQRFFVVLFKEQTGGAAESIVVETVGVPAYEPGAVEQRLTQELATTRDYLQSVIEQLESSNEELRAANEEIISSNEELRSTNEELQMAKEELQATNEELRTVNDELAVRNGEGTRLNNDLINVLNSIDLPIVILDADNRVRRYTPAASKLLGVRMQDLGRRLDEIKLLPQSFNLLRMVHDIVEHQIAIDDIVEDDKGHWYRIAVRPYVTALDRRIDGTLIVAYDVDETKRAEQLYLRAQVYAESIVNTVRECLIVLDRDLRVRSVNATFHRVFETTDESVQGRRLSELGVGEWNQPELISRIHQLKEDEQFDGLSFEHMVSTAKTRSFEVSGRRIAKTALVLLALNDVTETKRAKAQLEQNERRHEEALLRMAFDTVVAEEQERRRIAENLHDNIGQGLALAKIKLAGVRESMSEAQATVVDETLGLLSESVTCVSNLTFEISPPVLYDLGLPDALLWLADDLKARHGLKVDVSDDGEPKLLDDGTAMVVFRAVRELLINVYKHANVLEANVRLKRSDDVCQIEVEDSGAGFDVAAAIARRSDGGYGLMSLKERIKQVGGTVSITSHLGQGTRILMCIPLKAE